MMDDPGLLCFTFDTSVSNVLTSKVVDQLSEFSFQKYKEPITLRLFFEELRKKPDKHAILWLNTTLLREPLPFPVVIISNVDTKLIHVLSRNRLLLNKAIDQGENLATEIKAIFNELNFSNNYVPVEPYGDLYLANDNK